MKHLPPSKVRELEEFATVELHNGMTALVDLDAAVLEAVRTHHRWYAVLDGNVWYAMASLWKPEMKKQINTFLHRLVMVAQAGQIVDHRNGDGLDNRRLNLRIASVRNNSRNQRPLSNARSNYKGVDRAGRKWRARISLEGDKNRLFLGHFDTEEEAARAYDSAAKEHFGEFAYLNFGE